MEQVNVLEAKTHLSSLLRDVESGRTEGFVLARNGKPVARLVPYDETDASRRIGVAKGEFSLPADFDINEDDDMIADMFGAS